MAEELNGPAEIVEDKYARSVVLAETASKEVADFQRALNESIYKPEQISVQWQTLAAPSLPSIPDIPRLPDVEFAGPDREPAPLNASMEEVRIDDFNISMPVLNFGTAPVLNVGQAPTLPQVREVTIPDAPVVELPSAPNFLTLTTHSFGGVNLHEDWLSKLDEIPELSVLQPAPFAYRPGARYASELLGNLKAVLNARINGGTGIVPAVEQQIWDRARDRETQIALAREKEVLRSAEALGFPLPSGVMVAQLADARREYHEKLSSLSRDISIKQAELEQQNLKDSLQQALQLESTLMDDCHKLELLAFESAKAAADNAIAAHNAAVEHFKALLDGYRSYAAAYDTIIKAELNKVEVFKAMLQAEQTKADINKSLVDRFKAEIEGSMAAVEIYKARVGASQTLVELERTRIQAGAEEVRAFVAVVNAETAKADMYKAQVGAESAKADAVGALARAYGSKVGAQAEKARVAVAKFQALISAKALEWDGWKAKLAASTAKMDAATRQASIIVDGYKLGAMAAEAQAGSLMRRWEADIKQYDAGKELTFRVAQSNATAVTHANDARMEAAKVQLATAMQKVASSWAAVSASAQISGSVQQNISGQQ